MLIFSLKQVHLMTEAPVKTIFFVSLFINGNANQSFYTMRKETVKSISFATAVSFSFFFNINVCCFFLLP